MTFKKLALVAALATSFGAFAADVGVLPTTDDSTYTVEVAQPLLQTEFAAETAAVEGNQAYIVQEGNASVAYINQSTEEASFAAIAQVGDGALALIYQTGTLANKALIVTRGKVDSGNDAATYDVALADTADKLTVLGKGALLATAVMSAEANVAVINQTSDAGTNMAYIDQNVGDGTVDGNFAAIAQTAGSFNNLGMIAQMGTMNKALIVQSN